MACQTSEPLSCNQLQQPTASQQRPASTARLAPPLCAPPPAISLRRQSTCAQRSSQIRRQPISQRQPANLRPALRRARTSLAARLAPTYQHQRTNPARSACALLALLQGASDLSDFFFFGSFWLLESGLALPLTANSSSLAPIFASAIKFIKPTSSILILSILQPFLPIDSQPASLVTSPSSLIIVGSLGSLGWNHRAIFFIRLRATGRASSLACLSTSSINRQIVNGFNHLHRTFSLASDQSDQLQITTRIQNNNKVLFSGQPGGRARAELSGQIGLANGLTN